MNLAYALVGPGTIMRELRRGNIGRTGFEAVVQSSTLELGADHVPTLEV